MSNDSTPESSLDLHSLNQRQLILKHLDHGGSRKPWETHISRFVFSEMPFKTVIYDL